LVWNLGATAGPLPGTVKSTATSVKKTTTTKKKYVSRYGVPTFADSTKGDDADYDDPVVREVAVHALGRYNGSVVAIDPNNGRILSVVNQNLAFSAGFIPCSTIKPVIAVAALEENVITRDTMIPISRRHYMNLTEALAHSNNPYFEELGRRMGFDTVARYAHLLGLGELAGYNLSNEQPGLVPSEPPARGGVSRMSSFGEGIKMTPLQLGALGAAVANGGTLYYLQYPRSDEEKQGFEPRVKRDLNIGSLLPDVRDGMLAAVLYGTGRSSYDRGGEEQALGKTGTCSDQSSRIGWFVTYADQLHPKIVLVVLLRGQSHRIKGGTAALIAGLIYRGLRERNYFADASQPSPGTSASVASGSNGRR
jgi:cell division protein FtsI/penicillin-binding protein 2